SHPPPISRAPASACAAFATRSSTAACNSSLPNGRSSRSNSGPRCRTRSRPRAIATPTAPTAAATADAADGAAGGDASRGKEVFSAPPRLRVKKALLRLGDEPLVLERIAHPRSSLAVRLVRGRLDRGRAGAEGAFVHR